MDTYSTVSGFEPAHKAREAGFLIEALALADAMLDTLLNALVRAKIDQLAGSHEKGQDIYLLFGQTFGNTMDGRRNAMFLCHAGEIEDTLLKRIENFKETRNVAVHSLYYKIFGGSDGVEEMVMSKSVKGKKTRIKTKSELSTAVTECEDICAELSLILRKYCEMKR